ncbi:MAG TPA: RNA polymerase sigma factor [Thermoanaerobaculia bacterium]
MVELRTTKKMPINERELVEQFYERVVRYLVGGWRFTLEEARDLAQDVFVGVLRHMKEKRTPIEKPWKFLKTAAHHRAVNEFRSRHFRRHREVGSSEVIERLAELLLSDVWTGETPPSPEDLAAASQEYGRLREEIENLSPSLRPCLLLWLEGLSYEEIATALHLSVDAVRTRLRDAKKLLVQRLGPRGRS